MDGAKKTKLQMALADATPRQAKLLWDLLSSHIEDCEVSGGEVDGTLVELLICMDGAVAVDGEDNPTPDLKRTEPLPRMESMDDVVTGKLR